MFRCTVLTTILFLMIAAGVPSISAAQEKQARRQEKQAHNQTNEAANAQEFGRTILNAELEHLRSIRLGSIGMLRGSDVLPYDSSKVFGYVERWCANGNHCPDGQISEPRGTDCTHFISHALDASGIYVTGTEVACEDGLCLRVNEFAAACYNSVSQFSNVKQIERWQDARRGDFCFVAPWFHRKNHVMLLAEKPDANGAKVYGHDNNRCGTYAEFDPDDCKFYRIEDAQLEFTEKETTRREGTAKAEGDQLETVAAKTFHRPDKYWTADEGGRRLMLMKNLELRMDAQGNWRVSFDATLYVREIELEYIDFRLLNSEGQTLFTLRACDNLVRLTRRQESYDSGRQHDERVRSHYHDIANIRHDDHCTFRN